MSMWARWVSAQAMKLNATARHCIMALRATAEPALHICAYIAMLYRLPCIQVAERAVQVGQNLLRSGLSDYKSVDERMEEARKMQV